jgi:hypothetical protein
MPDTTTTNYGWTRPEVNASADTWGTKWNNNLTEIDADLKTAADLAQLAYSTALAASGTPSGVLLLSGGTMTGQITLINSDPTNANHAARKSYVDGAYTNAAAAQTTANNAAVRANNLSDLTNAGTARTNLGLGTLATRTTAAFADIATAAIATAAEYQANTASKLLSTDAIWAAALVETLTYAASYTPDLNQFINGEMVLTGNLTLNNPTNAKPGQSGMVVLVQDATGSRTITYGTAWKFPTGMVKTLSTAGSSVDVLFYTVRTSAYITCSLQKGYA